MHGSLGPWIPQEDILGIRNGIKTTRRKGASTKQFVKAEVRYQGGRAL